jgi:hypothetical protein
MVFECLKERFMAFVGGDGDGVLILLLPAAPGHHHLHLLQNAEFFFKMQILKSNLKPKKKTCKGLVGFSPNM